MTLFAPSLFHSTHERLEIGFSVQKLQSLRPISSLKHANLCMKKRFINAGQIGVMSILNVQILKVKNQQLLRTKKAYFIKATKGNWFALNDL